MRSSTAETRPVLDPAPAPEPARQPVRGFLAADRGSVLRLVVTLLLGAAALVGPHLASTSAQFTDTVQVPATVRTAPDFDALP